jgi:hypothetical protein
LSSSHPRLDVVLAFSEAVEHVLEALAGERPRVRGDDLLPLLEDLLGVGAQLVGLVLARELVLELGDRRALHPQVHLEAVDVLARLPETLLVLGGDPLAALRHTADASKERGRHSARIARLL